MGEIDLFDAAKSVRDQSVELLDMMAQGRRDTQYHGECLAAHLGSLMLEHIQQRRGVEDVQIEVAHAVAALILNIAGIMKPVENGVAVSRIDAINHWQAAVAQMLVFRIGAERDGSYEVVFADNAQVPDFRDQLKGGRG